MVSLYYVLLAVLEPGSQAVVQAGLELKEFLLLLPLQ